MNIPLKRYWDLLVDHLRPQKGRFALLTGLLLGSIGLQLVIPQVTRYFIDTATGNMPAGITSPSDDALALIALGFIGLALAQQITSVGARYFGEYVAWTATNELRESLAEHCLRLDMSFHNNISPGELIERIDGDVGELSNFFSQLVIRVVGNVVLMFGILVVLIGENYQVGLAFTVFALVTLYLLNRVRGIAVPHDRALREANADLFGFLEERLAGTEDIRANGAVDFVLKGLFRLQTIILRRWRKAWIMHLAVRLTAGITLTIGYGMAFYSGYTLYTAGAITIGTAYLIVSYTNAMARPIRELTQQVENLQNIGASIERLEELKRIQPAILDGDGPDVPAGPLAVTFDHVSFNYITNEPVLRDVSFTIEPGQVLGLLGRTGSGKTTLARLIFRLYDTSDGSISLDGTAIAGARIRQLRQRVALVTQDVQLFQATVRDNLTFFDPSIPDSRIRAAIEDLELGDWYAGLPKGLDTRLETGGRSLSAGEAQLLAFTRVFLRDPGLVILDEASSRLDPATEMHIERAIDRLLRDRTGIVIAHRLGTVHRADQIMILERGEIVEFGPRRDLAADAESRFFSLLQTGLEEVLA